MKYHFYAMLEKEDNYYNVTFPDLPGAITYGNNMNEAVEMATDVLGGHLLVMEDDEEVIPKPSDYIDLSCEIDKHQQLQLIVADTQIVRDKEDLNI